MEKSLQYCIILKAVICARFMVSRRQKSQANLKTPPRNNKNRNWISVNRDTTNKQFINYWGATKTIEFSWNIVPRSFFFCIECRINLLIHIFFRIQKQQRFDLITTTFQRVIEIESCLRRLKSHLITYNSFDVDFEGWKEESMEIDDI